jgi:NAD(P)-dependent dehydrogenase (short-subunit alcohol dehydrogenase family)
MKSRDTHAMDNRTVNSSVNGQVSIITGGSSGIGRATGIAMARAGATVIVVGSNPKHVADSIRLISECSDQREAPMALILDVSKEHDMTEMAYQTLTRYGRIDVLVSSAGIGKRRDSTRFAPYSFAQLPAEEWDAVLDTNLTGTFLANRAVLPAMIRQGSGVIINISSFQGGRKGQPFAPAYSASKFGIAGMSYALADEVRREGIRVEVLFPDVTDTALLQNSTLSSRFGSLLSPERIAEIIVYMAGLQNDCVITDLGVTSFAPQDRPC